MSNNKKIKKCFANIISIDDYESLIDQDKFEIDNDIRFCVENKYFMEDFIDHEEHFKNSKHYDNRDREGGYYLKSYPLNRELLDQIYQHYLFERRNYFGAELEIENIEFKLLSALNEKAIEKIIKKEYSKFTKKLNKLELAKDYFSAHKNLDFESEEFINYIKAHFQEGISEIVLGDNVFEEDEILNEEWPIYVDFITYKKFVEEGINIEFDKYWVFRELDKITECSKVLKFLKDYKEKLISKKRETSSFDVSNINVNYKIEEFHKHIFETKEAQKWFNDCLIKLDVLTKDGFAKGKRSSFRSVVNSIFRYQKCKIFVFVYGVNLTKYSDFLDEIYQANINGNKLTTTQSNYEKIKICYEEYEKTLKETLYLSEETIKTKQQSIKTDNSIWD